MNNFLFLSIFLCFHTVQAQGIQFSEYQQHTQSELKATIEREQKLQSAQRHRVLYERASSLESIQLQKQNYSAFKKLSSQAKSWWHSTQEYMRIQILQKLGIKDFGRRVWRTLQGKRSLPPTSNGLFYSIHGDSKLAKFHIIAEDPDGTIDRFEFDYGDGTSQVVSYSDYEKMFFHIDHLYLINENYNVSVKVVDDTGDYSIFTQFVVIINNDLPAPKFTIQKNQVPNFLKADFTSLSTDTDGTIVNYFWNFGDGNFHTTNSGAPFSHTYSAPGTYYVSLDVWDNNGGQAYTGSAPVHIGITPPAGGSPPFAIVRSDKRAGVVPFTVQLNGEGSFDLEGSPLSYEWDIGDNSHPFKTSNLSEAKFTLTQPGTYYAYLKMTDTGGQSNYHYFTIYGLPENSLRAPTIVAYPSGDKSVAFDSSRYALNVPASHQMLFWDFGDGSPEVNQIHPMHTYAAYGTYTVTLRAYDVLGNYHVVQKTLNITNDLSTPQSFFNASSLSGPVDTTITFTTQNQHLVASTTTAIWDFGDGSRQTGLHEDLLIVTHSYEEPGLYPVTLIVTDVDGKSSVFTSQVLVHEQTPIVTARAEVSDLIGKVPFPVRFDGRSSSSTAGPISSIRWQLDTQWGQIHNQSPVMTQVFNAGGDIWGRMYAIDSAGNMGVQFFSVVAVDPAQVPPWNNAPVAQIHINFDNQYATGWVELNGFSSYDPDGDRIISYEWSFDGKILPQSSWGVAHLAANDTEEHIVGLKVMDRWGSIGETSVRFRYPQDHQTPPANLPPVGLIQIDYLNVGNPAQVRFSSAGSYDPDGDRIARYEWNLDGSSLGEGDAITTSVEDGLEHIITLKLTDRWGASSERKIRFRNPLVSYLVTPDRPVVDEEVHFYTDHLTIQLPETTITQQRWDFGDGSPFAYGPHVQHIYTAEGTYTTTLLITDNLNRTYTATQTVTVEEELAPIVKITARDMQPIYEVHGPQNFNWSTFPVEVQFDLNRSSVQGMGLVNAVWNFGDGETGFGLNPTWYFIP